MIDDAQHQLTPCDGWRSLGKRRPVDWFEYFHESVGWQRLWCASGNDRISKVANSGTW